MQNPTLASGGRRDSDLASSSARDVHLTRLIGRQFCPDSKHPGSRLRRRVRLPPKTIGALALGHRNRLVARERQSGPCRCRRPACRCPTNRFDQNRRSLCAQVNPDHERLGRSRSRPRTPPTTVAYPIAQSSTADLPSWRHRKLHSGLDSCVVGLVSGYECQR
jgi:hypothetical protein